MHFQMEIHSIKFCTFPMIKVSNNELHSHFFKRIILFPHLFERNFHCFTIIEFLFLFEMPLELFIYNIFICLIRS